jgi:peptidoglycan/LPS O-acetylase OafA/YrhL
LTSAGSQPHRLAALDGLRFIAAVLVMGYHYVSGYGFWHTGQSLPFPALHQVFAFGFLGVQLFFIISGFVICMSSWGRSLSQFFVSRVVRLYPAYWFAIIFTTAVVTLLPEPHRRLPLGQVLANLTMTQSALGVGDVDGVYWSLWRELLFYLLFAAVVWRGVSYRRVVAFCMLWTTASVVAVPLKSPVLNILVGQQYSMYFIAGIAMYLMHRFGPNSALWAILGFSFLLALHGAERNAPPGGHLQTYIIIGCFAAVLAVALGWFDRIRWRWLSTLGTLTYPLYLLHAYAGLAVIQRFSPSVPKYLLLAALVAFMLLLSWLVVRFVERPLSRAMRRRLTAAFETIRRADEARPGKPPAPQAAIPPQGMDLPDPEHNRAKPRHRIAATSHPEDAVRGIRAPNPLLVVDQRPPRDGAP